MNAAQRKKKLKNWKNVNRELSRDNKKYGKDPVMIPKEEWPERNPDLHTLKPIACWRSKRFFIQVVEDQSGAIRISVNRTQFDENFNFVDGITWDDLYHIKNSIGYAHLDCIEIYPSAQSLVNVANIRHLFVLPETHPYNWRLETKKKS